MRVVLVGGGTGGHFYPLIAIAEALQESTVRLYYMGPDPHDKEMLDAHNITFVRCPAGKLRRYFSLQNFFDIFKTITGFFTAFLKLFWIYPDVVMSKGGYTSVPVVLAAWLLRIPIVIHESDAAVGRANKLAKRFARYVAISYPEAAQFFPKEKTALTGIPIRKEFLTPATGDEKSRLGVDQNRPLILVLGGSLGAENINNLTMSTLDELLPSFSVIHQTGKQHFEVVKETVKSMVVDKNLLEHYHPTPYLSAENMNMAMHAASLIVSRAGSTLLFEIALHGTPSIIIPIPESVSHDQRSNAYAYARSGAATVMEEGNLEDSLLAAEITRIMNSPELYAGMREAALGFAPQGAAEKIAGILRKIGQEHE